MCRCPEKSKVITQNKKIISLSQCIVWALTHTAKVSAELSQDISMLLMNKNALQNAIFNGNVRFYQLLNWHFTSVHSNKPIICTLYLCVYYSCVCGVWK